jgi:hypothetical protein
MRHSVMITKSRYMMLLGWIAMNSSRQVQIPQGLGSTRLEAPSGAALVERRALVGSKVDLEILMICSKNSNSSSQ